MILFERVMLLKVAAEDPLAIKTGNSLIMQVQTIMLLIKIFLVNILLTSCSLRLDGTSYGDLPTYSSAGNLQMIVEIPAGTNKKLEYDSGSNTFQIDIKNGKKRIINYLPYPGNYGFLPSTNMDLWRGGDGDALDVMLLSENISTGSVIEIIPIAIIYLKDSGQDDNKIIAVPFDKGLRVLNINNYDELDTNFFAVKKQIQLWFQGYKGNKAVTFLAWGDEMAAKAEIDKWRKKK